VLSRKEEGRVDSLILAFLLVKREDLFLILLLPPYSPPRFFLEVPLLVTETPLSDEKGSRTLICPESPLPSLRIDRRASGESKVTSTPLRGGKGHPVRGKGHAWGKGRIQNRSSSWIQSPPELLSVRDHLLSSRAGCEHSPGQDALRLRLFSL
jgi:hypothetical protein